MRLRNDTKVSLLANVPLFERCSRRDLAKIAAIAHETDFPAATAVVSEGDVGSEMFIVLEGEVDVRRGGRKLATLRKGHFFGEIALITGSVRTATVTTGTPLTALVLSRNDFRKLLADSPALQFKLLQEVAERLEQLTAGHAHQRVLLRY
jgi:CRP-like cAMP-binding protein